jgi:TRAP-type C4-dicarboxylate transport system permease small subunit
MLKIFRWLTKAQLYLYNIAACAFLLVVVGATGLQVFSRYVLNSSFSWTEELARYTFIWMNMLGASYVLKNESNAVVDFFGNLLKGKARFTHRLYVFAMISLVAGIFIFQGFKMAMVGMYRPSAALGVPMGWIYMAIPVGSVGILIQSLEKMVDIFVSVKNEKDVSC